MQLPGVRRYSSHRNVFWMPLWIEVGLSALPSCCLIEPKSSLTGPDRVVLLIRSQGIRADEGSSKVNYSIDGHIKPFQHISWLVKSYCLARLIIDWMKVIISVRNSSWTERSEIACLWNLKLIRQFQQLLVVIIEIIDIYYVYGGNAWRFSEKKTEWLSNE